MKKLPTMLMPLLAIAALASGWASAEPQYSENSHGNVRSTPNRSIAVIKSIKRERGPKRKDSALLGTVVGGVVGAAAGHQVGKGRTNHVATVAGAVGGAAIGRKIDKAHDRNKDNDTYVIRVRFPDGNRQTITQNGLGGLRVGDSVRIEDGSVRRL
jgi:outer membrane lipoprotein SlyB